MHLQTKIMNFIIYFLYQAKDKVIVVKCYFNLGVLFSNE